MALTLAQRFNNSRLDTLVLHGVAWAPGAIKTSSNVCTIECAKNTKTPPPEIREVKQIATIRLEWCEELDLAETFTLLADVPNLKKLHLKNCSIQRIPPEIWSLYNLKYLSFSNDTYVDNNEFETFPPELGYLENLLELDLCANRKFKKFPPEAAKLRDLRSINLREVDFLPENTELIPNLKHLRLYKSRIGWAQIEPLVNRPNGLESVTVEDFMYHGFKERAAAYPQFSVHPEDSGHGSRGEY